MGLVPDLFNPPHEILASHAQRVSRGGSDGVFAREQMRDLVRLLICSREQEEIVSAISLLVETESSYMPVSVIQNEIETMVALGAKGGRYLARLHLLPVEMRNFESLPTMVPLQSDQVEQIGKVVVGSNPDGNTVYTRIWPALFPSSQMMVMPSLLKGVLRNVILSAGFALDPLDAGIPGFRFPPPENRADGACLARDMPRIRLMLVATIDEIEAPPFEFDDKTLRFCGDDSFLFDDLLEVYHEYELNFSEPHAAIVDRGTVSRQEAYSCLNGECAAIEDVLRVALSVAGNQDLKVLPIRSYHSGLEVALAEESVHLYLDHAKAIEYQENITMLRGGAVRTKVEAHADSVSLVMERRLFGLFCSEIGFTLGLNGGVDARAIRDILMSNVAPA